MEPRYKKKIEKLLEIKSQNNKKLSNVLSEVKRKKATTKERYKKVMDILDKIQNKIIEKK